MKITPAWISAGIAAGTIILGALAWGANQWVDEAVAQEVQRQTAPLQAAAQDLEAIKESLRRAEDRELIDRCEARAERRGETPAEFEPVCKAESAARWRAWKYEDCIARTADKDGEAQSKICGPPPAAPGP
jgi:hypothetical protein